MNKCIFLAAFLATLSGSAATYEWTAGIVPGGVWGKPEIKLYAIGGGVYVDGAVNAIAETGGEFIGYGNDTGVYLKQQDQDTTPMPVGNNYWVVAYYGDILNHETIATMERIELCNWEDYSSTGGTLIDNPDDFYLGSMSTGYWSSDGIDRFSWYHLSLDDELQMSLIDAGIGFYGESVVVGLSPEPSSLQLLLVGLACFSLRRRRYQTPLLATDFPPTPPCTCINILI